MVFVKAHRRRTRAWECFQPTNIAPLLLICSVFSLTACTEAPSPAPKPAQPVKEQPLRSATLAEQKVCDEQARKKFHEDNPRPNELINYRSHYDPKANICYIRVDSTTAKKDYISTGIVIYDAFEGRQYGSYIWINNQGKKYWEVPPTECIVKPLGKEEITCSSVEEFNKLAESQFGIGD